MLLNRPGFNSELEQIQRRLTAIVQFHLSRTIKFHFSLESQQLAKQTECLVSVLQKYASVVAQVMSITSFFLS